MNAREILAQNLRNLRAERGMSQEDLAHEAQIDRTYVSALERCLYAASVDVLEQIAEAFAAEVAVLLRVPTDGG
jgi:transcriptional regulator with XRE-family HTH domain